MGRRQWAGTGERRGAAEDRRAEGPWALFGPPDLHTVHCGDWDAIGMKSIRPRIPQWEIPALWVKKNKLNSQQIGSNGPACQHFAGKQ